MINVVNPIMNLCAGMILGIVFANRPRSSPVAFCLLVFCHLDGVTLMMGTLMMLR